MIILPRTYATVPIFVLILKVENVLLQKIYQKRGSTLYMAEMDYVDILIKNIHMMGLTF